MTTRTIIRAHGRISSVLTLFGLVCSFLLGATPSAFAAPRHGAPAHAVTAMPVTPACYTIVSQSNTQALTLVNDTGGTRLVVRPQTLPERMDKHQLWNVRSDGAIVSAANGMVVDVLNANQSPGTSAIIWPEQTPPAPNQHWTVADDGVGNVTITSQLDGQVLDVDGGDKQSVILYPANGGANQHWWISSVDPANCVPSARIWDMKVISVGNSSISCPSGYEKNSQDINEGAGGDYIYLCLDRTNVSGNTTPVRRIGVVSSLFSSASCGGGFTRINTDLNKGAGGVYMYFCYSRSAGDSSGDLADVRFVSRNSSLTTQADGDAACASNHGPGYTIVQSYSNGSWGDTGWIPVDLNMHVGGKYIYTCQKRI